jgi:hypothetical protein
LPLQVLLPVYGSSCLVAILVHRRGHVVGRCVFKLYGLMPLLLRDHSKSLTLYRCAHSKKSTGFLTTTLGSLLHAKRLVLKQMFVQTIVTLLLFIQHFLEQSHGAL